MSLTVVAAQHDRYRRDCRNGHTADIKLLLLASLCASVAAAGAASVIG
jgi:hypothetical protein